MSTADRVEYDVLLIGGSPSNLALAHQLVDKAKASGLSFSMAILEKGKTFGAHIVSGAVVKPGVIQELFPDWEERKFPIESVCTESRLALLGSEKRWEPPNALLPPGFVKTGYWVLTLSHVVNWMVNRLQEKLAETPNVTVDFFPGFAAHKVVFEGEGSEARVAGVQVLPDAEIPEDESPELHQIFGKVVCFGDKGFVSREVLDKFALRDNPQLWSVGVKEVWQLPEGKSQEGNVWHTMGFPLTDGSFGGGFIYGMKNNRLTIGMVISLDSENPNINPQQKLQDLKKHPWVQSMIDGGTLQHYGAAILPEGGYYSLPKQFQVNGALLLGDALGVLEITSLAGVDRAMACGMYAAEVLHTALEKGDFSADTLKPYQAKVMSSFVGQSLKQSRYFRKAWQENPRLMRDYLPTVLEGVDAGAPIGGLISVGLKNNPFQALGDALRLKTLMDGNTDIGPVSYKPDYAHIVPNFQAKPIRYNQADKGLRNTPGKNTIYSREDAVFYANTKYHEHNAHIDEFNADVCLSCIRTYDGLGKDTPCVSDCTAEVHRVDVVDSLRKHGMSLENCVQCRTCEIVCPEVNLRVHAASQGSGPDFTGL